MSGLVGYLRDRIAIFQSVGAGKVSECLRCDCIRVLVEYLIDRHSKGTEKQGGKQQVGISIAHRRPYVTGQRPAYAAKSAETGGIATDTLP